MAPRSRLPVSPSIEARLSTSQDSLASSTGSNQELKTQLDSTLKEVEAIAEHLEKQKKPPLEKTRSSEQSSPPADPGPKPMIRRKTSEQLTRALPSNGARPRVSLNSIPDPKPRPSVVGPATSTPSVVLRQSSWSSREQVNHDSNGVGGNFSSSKSLWEKRSINDTMTNTAADNQIGSLRGGFRSNRDFWNQRVAIQQKAKQTPDLVLDLPANSTVKPKPRPRINSSMTADSNSSGNGVSRRAISASDSSSNSGDENLTADQFAKPDRNTLRKSSNASNTNKNDLENSNETPKRIPPVQARILQQKKSPPDQ